jgi:F0F1-type ATP synthase assembly protein I
MKNKYIIFAAMGMELIGIIVGCLFIGQKIDEIYGLKGLAMIGLSMLGLAGWIYHIVVLSRNMDPDVGE